MSEESAQLVTSITKGQARELIQRSLPVPDGILRAHSSSLLNIALKHQQLRTAVSTASELPVSMKAAMSECAGTAYDALLHVTAGRV